MSDSKPLRCQKCGKPIGYVTVLAKGLLNFQQPVKNVKLVAICMECASRNYLLPQKLLTYSMLLNVISL